MDGFAIRFEDASTLADRDEVALTVVGESLPGKPFTGTIGPGECTAIATGAVVPNGADTLVRWESVDRRGEGNRDITDIDCLHGEVASVACT